MPARLSKLKKAVSGQLDLEKPSSGSHWKFTDGSSKYTVPAHNGLKTEITDLYIKKLCAHFGLDYAEIKASM